MTAGGAAPASRRRLGAGFWVFIALMLALTSLFIVLGVWQLNRLAEKEALIAAVSSGLVRPPVPLPAASEWQSADSFVDPAKGRPIPFGATYRPYTATGHYVPEDTVLVFTSISDARGPYSGPGYWVMTPLALATGGAVFVNRGFVPQDRADAYASGGALPQGEATVTGIGMPSEAAGSFTPAPDAADRIDWIRNTERLAAMSPGLPRPVLPIYLDAPAGAPGTLPQGGETVVEFPNNHFGYALTWFGFALLTPALLAYWIFRQLRPKTGADDEATPV